jgi:bifunctional DNA-binding transcriptional regulator/antitoxin component of YhaV-PrlF toxin-antitoxin module
MSLHTSTVTTKGQTTVPEPIRTALGLQIGKMLVWELTPGENGRQQLTVHPSPELDELAGCLKSEVPFAGLEEEKKAARKARTRNAEIRDKRSLRR